MSQILVVGASRGLGAALAQSLAAPGDTIFVLSRSRPSYVRDSQGGGGVSYIWIEADLRRPRDSVDAVAVALGSTALDLAVYNAGIWEHNEYSRSTDEDLLDIVNVNLATPVVLFRRILPNLLSAENPLVLLIGSTCGLENEGSKSVAYTATKFGLRGLAHSLREVGRAGGIRVTCISPGSIASDVEVERGTELALKRYDGRRMPMSDIIKLVTTLREMSPASCAKEIVLPALADTDV